MEKMKRVIENLAAWLAMFGFVYWTAGIVFTWLIMGGWGGTRELSIEFLSFVFSGYLAYGLVQFVLYLSCGRLRLLPWRAD